MLWSLLKVVLFFCLVALAAYAAVLLLQAEGTIRVAMAGVEFSLGPLQAAIAAVLIFLAVWTLLALLNFLGAFLRFLFGDETALTRHFGRRRERKGYRALADGMLALAAGEGREAMAKASRAERYLHRPELTDLVTAQAAEMVGDRRKSEEVYKRLLQSDRTRFVGVRGLLAHKLADGDTGTALALAQKAFALKPKHADTQDILLRLQAGQEDWSGARRTLGAKLKHGTLPRDVYRRRDAVLALSEARGIIDEGKSIEARENAIEANRLSPDLIPAAAMAARAYIANNQTRYATRVLRKAWEVHPHPDLAAAYAEIEPDETPRARIGRFGALVRSQPDHPETRMLMAELQIANEDFPEARRALGDLATAHPTARSVTIMAAIARGEGADDAVVRGWLTRALSVPRGPSWVCDNCQNIHADWRPTCQNCGAFDTLSWREPQDGVVAIPNAAPMLPLVVGRVEPPHVDVVPDPHDSHGPTDTPPHEGDLVDPPRTPVTADTPPTATRIPDAEVIVPPDQRDAANRRSVATDDTSENAPPR